MPVGTRQLVGQLPLIEGELRCSRATRTALRSSERPTSKAACHALAPTLSVVTIGIGRKSRARSGGSDARPEMVTSTRSSWPCKDCDE